MKPRNSNLDPDPPEFPPQSKVPRWLLLVGVATMLSVMGMGYISLRVVHRIRQFKGLAAQIRQEYQGLDAEFPFSTPLPPTEPTPEKLTIYVNARESFATHIAPPVEERAREILANGEAASIMDVAQLFGDFYEFLSEGTQAHIHTLRAEKMGPSEFFWIHGYVVHGLLGGPEEDARRRQIESTLSALERGSAPLTSASRRFEAESFREELGRRYAGYRGLRGQDLGAIKVTGDAMACLDIIGATPRLHRGLGLLHLPPEDLAPTRTSAQTAALHSPEDGTDGLDTRDPR